MYEGILERIATAGAGVRTFVEGASAGGIVVDDCVQLERGRIDNLGWLPSTCAYRLRAAGEPLKDWHYLVSGDRDAYGPSL